MGLGVGLWDYGLGSGTGGRLQDIDFLGEGQHGTPLGQVGLWAWEWDYGIGIEIMGLGLWDWDWGRDWGWDWDYGLGFRGCGL